jgi:hypothetical protein
MEVEKQLDSVLPTSPSEVIWPKPPVTTNGTFLKMPVDEAQYPRWARTYETPTRPL